MSNNSELIIQNLKEYKCKKLILYIFNNPNIWNKKSDISKKDLKEDVRHLIKQCDIVHDFLIEQCDMLDTDMEYAIGDISTLLRLINNNI